MTTRAAFSLVPLLLGALAESGGGAPIPVVDLHVDLVYQVEFKGKSPRVGAGNFLADHLEGAGYAGVVLPLYVPKHVSDEGVRVEDLERAYAAAARIVADTPPLASGGCAATGGVRAFYSFEGMGPLGAVPESIKVWKARGVAIFGLVHSYDNQLASSSGVSHTYPRPTFGLTDAGRQVTREVFDAGGLVDVSHASDRAIDEVLALAAERGGVVVATHSNARAIHDHPRNLTDEQLRAIAATGGFVGVNFHSDYLVAGRRATLADVVRHIEHVVSVVGVEHAAIGSDFEGGVLPPKELVDVRGLPRLADALISRGMTREQVTAIFSGTALGVLCPSAPAPPPSFAPAGEGVEPPAPTEPASAAPPAAPSASPSATDSVKGAQPAPRQGFGCSG